MKQYWKLHVCIRRSAYVCWWKCSRKYMTYAHKCRSLMRLHAPCILHCYPRTMPPCISLFYGASGLVIWRHNQISWMINDALLHTKRCCHGCWWRCLELLLLLLLTTMRRLWLRIPSHRRMSSFRVPTVAAAEATTISSFNPQTRRTRWRSSCENEEKEWRVGGVREKLRGWEVN